MPDLTNTLYRTGRFIRGGFTFYVSGLAISLMGILIAFLVYSHFSYKSSQKKLFMEKWDLIAERISREASKSITNAGIIDDDFASYLYWIPAISNDIVAIRLVDIQNNPIYATGAGGEADELMDECTRTALKGNRRFVFPDHSGIVHTIIAVPVYINEKVEAALLLTVDDSPEKIGVKSAFLKPFYYVVIAIFLLALILFISIIRVRAKADKSEFIHRLQTRLANPLCGNMKEILGDGLNEIATSFTFKAGSICVRNAISGQYELMAYYPQDKNARKLATLNFEPADPRLQAVAQNKILLYDKYTKKSISLKDVGKSNREIEIVLPLNAESAAVGILNLTLSDKRFFNAEVLLNLKQISEILSYSILRALEKEDIITRGNNLQYILDLIESVRVTSPMSDILGNISEKIASTPGVTFCRIFLTDDKNKSLELVAEAVSGEGSSRKPDNLVIDLEEMPIHKVAMISGQSQLLRSDELEKLSLKKHNLDNSKIDECDIQIIPLIFGGLSMGCLTVGTVSPGEEHFANKDILENIAHYLSSILQILLPYSRMKKSFDHLTDTHRRDLRLARFEAISELANGITRNLDVTMNSFLEDLRKLSVLKQEHSLSVIIRSINEHIAAYQQMLEKFRAFSTINSAGKLHRVELAGFIKKAENNLALDMESWPVNAGKLRVLTLNSGSGQIFADEDELYKALSCIILNAAEAMPYGGDITIESKVDGKMAVLEIKDQGSGMNDSEVKNIFQPFFTTKEGLARGLGLSIAHRIIILHNGRLDVESEPGRGSTFIIRIPLIDPEQTALYTLKKKSSGSIPLS
jgi:signal transduction histidine kinase